MKKIYDDLWQSTRFSSGILNTHAYFLKRDIGNILFYNTNDDTDLSEIEKLGGITYQILSHRDEVGRSLVKIKSRFNSKLCTSKIESEYANIESHVDIVFSNQDQNFENLEIINTPGHTDGSQSYFYKSPTGKNYIFTGDTLFQWNGKWSTLILRNSGGNKQELGESLMKLKNICPDVVISSGFVGEVSVVEVTKNEWDNAINSQLKKITG